jgi:hypothetical protein
MFSGRNYIERGISLAFSLDVCLNYSFYAMKTFLASDLFFDKV